MAELQNGTIAVESQPGVGSTFTLWLPAAAAFAPPEGETRRQADRAALVATRSWVG